MYTNLTTVRATNKDKYYARLIVAWANNNGYLKLVTDKRMYEGALSFIRVYKSFSKNSSFLDEFLSGLAQIEKLKSDNLKLMFRNENDFINFCREIILFGNCYCLPFIKSRNRDVRIEHLKVIKSKEDMFVSKSRAIDNRVNKLFKYFYSY